MPVCWHKTSLLKSTKCTFKAAFHWTHCNENPGGGGGGGGTPIYFLYRDVPTVRVSFSRSPVLNRVYNFTFSCLKQGYVQTFVPFLALWIQPAWSRLKQGKKLQHFLLDRVAKFTSFVPWTGSGSRWVGWTPLPKFLLRTPPGKKEEHRFE